jgi:hypothetical protein
MVRNYDSPFEGGAGGCCSSDSFRCHVPWFDSSKVRLFEISQADSVNSVVKFFFTTEITKAFHREIIFLSGIYHQYTLYSPYNLYNHYSLYSLLPDLYDLHDL